MTAESAASPRPSRVLLTWAAALLPLALVIWIVRARWSDVSQAGAWPGWTVVIIAVLANVVGNLLLIVAWRRQLRLSGSDAPSWSSAVVVWSTSQLSRLLFPGATVGARAVLGRRHGIRASVGAWTTLLELAWQLSIGPLVILATLPAWQGVAAEYTWLAGFAVVPGALLLGLVVRPVRVLRLIAGLLQRVPGLGQRVPALDDVAVDLDSRQAARLFGIYLVNYAVRAFAFVALLSGYVDLDGSLLALAIGANALGRFVGMIAVFAPGGIGPREGVTALVLGAAVGSSVLALVAVARLAEVVAEGLVYVGGRLAHSREATPGEQG